MDTAVEQIDEGCYRASVLPAWDLWGPVGGYVASIALRAAGAYSTMPLPASLSCHYLSPPKFGEVELETKRLRASRRAESIHVRVTQDRRPVLEALVWAVADGLAGPTNTWIQAPKVPPPEDLNVFASAEIGEQDPVSAAPYWQNVEIRKIPDDGDSPVSWVRSWDRYLPRSAFDDPWIDACREVMSADVSVYPAMAQALPSLAFIAPNLDLYVAFHAPAPQSDYFLLEANAAAAGSGLVGGNIRIWSPDGVLTATGNSQLLCRFL